MTRHHAGASWTLTTTTPTTTDLPPPFFLIDQRQRDGCDDLPVARRSSGKKGGGGWGGGRREVRYERWGTKPPPSRTKIVVRLLIRVERPEGCAMGDKSPPLWTTRVDRGSNNMISCCSMRCSGAVVQDATRHHAGASWTLTTTTPATTDLPPPFSSSINARGAVVTTYP